MSVVSQRYANIDRFSSTAKATPRFRAHKLTVEGFRVSLFNKIVAVTLFVVIGAFTIGGMYTIPAIQYMFTFLTLVSIGYGIWTFHHLAFFEDDETDES